MLLSWVATTTMTVAEEVSDALASATKAPAAFVTLPLPTTWTSWMDVVLELVFVLFIIMLLHVLHGTPRSSKTLLSPSPPLTLHARQPWTSAGTRCSLLSFHWRRRSWILAHHGDQGTHARDARRVHRPRVSL